MDLSRAGLLQAEVVFGAVKCVVKFGFFLFLTLLSLVLLLLLAVSYTRAFEWSC